VSHYVLICGSRNQPDPHTRNAVHDVLQFLHWFYDLGLRVLHGDAPGIDRTAHQWCIDHGVTVRAYPADWGRGRRAGPERNQRKANNLLAWSQQGHSVEVIAFAGGRGTSHMTSYAEQLGLDVTHIELEPPQQPAFEQPTLGV